MNDDSYRQRLTARFFREAQRRLRDIYGLALPSIEYTWQGTAFLNTSLLPAVYLPECDMTMIAVHACNGRGLGVNTILGGEIANLLARGDPDSTSIPFSRPKGIPMHRLASTAPKVIMTLARHYFHRSADGHGVWRRRPPLTGRVRS